MNKPLSLSRAEEQLLALCERDIGFIFRDADAGRFSPWWQWIPFLGPRLIASQLGSLIALGLIEKHLVGYPPCQAWRFTAKRGPR